MPRLSWVGMGPRMTCVHHQQASGRIDQGDATSDQKLLLAFGREPLMTSDTTRATERALLAA